MAPDKNEKTALYIRKCDNWFPVGISANDLTIGSGFRGGKTFTQFCQFFGNPEIERYIINENATIIFWTDGTKTISKRNKEDKFDKEIGFLLAYYYKKCGYSHNARKRILDSIDYNKIKTFLFEFYVKDTRKTYSQARSYLKNLKVDNK